MKVYYDNTLYYQEVNIHFQTENGENAKIDHTFLNRTEEELFQDGIPSEELEFAHSWVYYYHDGTGDDYSKESFEKLAVIDSVYELWDFFKQIKNVQDGLSFLVREGVSPCWDDPINSHLWWIKRKNLSPEEACGAWADLAISTVGISVFKNHKEYLDTINSISVAYKDGDYVFKIMMNSKVDDPSLYNTISLGKDFNFDFIKGGRLIENTGGKKKENNYVKKTNGGGSCKKFSPKKNYRKPLKQVN